MADADRLEEHRKAVDATYRRAVKAHRRARTLAGARSALPAGSSRAKVTTSNARWARAAEDRDRAFADLTMQLHEALRLIGPLGVRR